MSAPVAEEPKAAEGEANPASPADVVVFSGQPATDFDQMNQSAELEKLAIARYKVKTLVDSWKESQAAERELRSKFAWAIYAVLAFEVLVASAAFFMIGFGVINIPEWVAATFFTAIFAKIAGMILLILKHLFPTQRSPILETIERL